MNFLKNFLIEEDGQDMVEYGLIIGLAVLACVAAYTTFGADITDGITKQATKAKASMETNTN